MKQQNEESAIHLSLNHENSDNRSHCADLRATLAGCEKGNFERAVQNIKKLSNRYNKEGEEVPYNVDVQYFKKYGTGIYLFFHLSKRFAILFAIFAFISIIPVILNATNGSAFSSMIKTLGVYFAQTTVGNLNSDPNGATKLSQDASNRYKLHNSVPDLAICFTLLAFYLYWQVKSDKLTDQIKEEVKFQCHYTLEVNQFPQGVTEQELEEFFSQFGKVKEIASVLNYSEMIDQSKDIYELQQSKKEVLLSLESIEDVASQDKQKVKIKQYNEKIAEIENSFILKSQEGAVKALKHYIIYDDIYSRQKAIKTLKSYEKCCSWRKNKIPDEYLLKGEQVVVSACHNEPGDIIWENQHVPWQSKMLRGIVQILLLLIVIAITFLVISILNLGAPSTSTSLNVSMYNASSILNVTNSTILYVWCLDNKDMMDKLSSIDKLCSNYITQYYSSLAIGVIISCIVVGVKFVVKKIVIALAKFQKYKSHTDQSIGIMRNLFYTYICTTSLITILLQANIFGLSFKSLILNLTSNAYLRENSLLMHQFQDFVPFWFVDIGYKINLTMVIIAFQAPIVSPILMWIKYKFREWRASRQVTQKSMEDIITPDAFEIEDHYANMLLIMFISCSFSSGMPLIMIPCGFAFVLRYFYFKLVFIRFNHIPNSLDEALNESVLNIIPFVLIFHCLFGIWMYSTNSIFVQEQSFVSNLLASQSSFSQSFGNLLIRFGSTWYFTISLFVFICVLILKIIFYDIIYQSYKSRTGDRLSTENLNDLQVETLQIKIQPINELLETKQSLTNSYKIENNPKYFQILVIMNKLKDRRSNS